MADKYKNFEELAAHEVEGVDYGIRMTDKGSRIAILAPHAGEIELGSSQLADAIAKSDYTLYCFEGLKPGRPHSDLHITSSRFNEPRGLRIATSAEVVVGVHGCKDEAGEDVVLLGGRHFALRDLVAEELRRAGFRAKTEGHDFPGTDPANICNRGSKKAGLQIEVPWTLRERLRENPAQLEAFAEAVRTALKQAL